MTAALDRTFAVLELLAQHPNGLSVQSVAETLSLAPSATHRLLNDLVRLGYAAQPQANRDYVLTLRFAALGLGYLGRLGVGDVIQPVLEALAAESRELVRLSLVDGDRLVWVAVAQGATSGLRYDPAREQGVVVPLAYSAGGRAWAASLEPLRARDLILQQGVTPPAGAVEGCQLRIEEIEAMLARDRDLGFSEAVDCFEAGMAALAVVVRRPEGQVIGCLSIAGPSVRLTSDRRRALLPALHQAAQTVGELLPASPLLRWSKP